MRTLPVIRTLRLQAVDVTRRVPPDAGAFRGDASPGRKLRDSLVAERPGLYRNKSESVVCNDRPFCLPSN